jgi:hypothetical protein
MHETEERLPSSNFSPQMSAVATVKLSSMISGGRKSKWRTGKNAEIMPQKYKLDEMSM